MKITALSTQQKNKNRINVMVDGKYRFSLDVFQLAELGIRTDREYSEEELVALEDESRFGKVYGRAFEYCFVRPHSAKEMRDYLYKKTRSTRTKTGEVKKGVSPTITARVFDRLFEKGYIDDEKFTRYWVENRSIGRGASQRKLQAELRLKGVESSIISKHLQASFREDSDELQKIITKKQGRYPDQQKFMQYLARQGFSYDDIKKALSSEN